MGLRADLLCLQYWPFHRQHLGRMKLCVTDYLGVHWATRVCDLSIPELQLKPIKTSSEMFLRARYWICEGINGFVETISLLALQPPLLGFKTIGLPQHAMPCTL